MDDMGNTESNYFSAQEPIEQKVERINEKNKIRGSKQFLDDVIDRLEKRIAFYDTLSAIEVDADTSPEVHLRIVLANKQTAQNLTEEKEYFKTLRESVE